MLWLLENGIMRGIIRVTRSRLKPLTRSSILAQDASVATPGDWRSRLHCTLARRMALEAKWSPQHSATAMQLLTPIQSATQTLFCRRYAASAGRSEEKSCKVPPRTERTERPDRPDRSDRSDKTESRSGRTRQQALSSDLLPTGVEAFMNARPFDEIPGPTAIYQCIPFAGTRLLYYPFSKHTTEDMGSMLSKLQAKYGPILRVKLGMDWIVLVENISDIERVVQESENEDKDIRLRPNQSINVLGKRVDMSSLPLLEGFRYTKRIRQAVTSRLQSKPGLERYLARQEEMAEDLIKCIQQQQSSSQEVQTLCYRYTIESVAQLCFNERVGLLGEHFQTDGEKQQLVDSYRMVSRCMGEAMTGTRVLHLLFDDPFAKRFKEAKTIVQAWERQLMREATMSAIRDKGDAAKVTERSLVLSLLDDKVLGEQEIHNSIHSLMVFGSDFSASSLQMLLYSLATNVDKQEKLAAQITEVLGPEGKIKPNMLESMDYLNAVVKESLRLHFPMPAGGLACLPNNIVLSNYLIPSGTGIVVNSRRTAKNPVWFDHPHFFLPERWFEESVRHIPKVAYMPFGFGSNRLLHKSFVLQEINVAIVKILQKFKVDLPGEYQSGSLDTVYVPYRTPKDPLPFYFTPRSSTSK